MNMPYPYDEDVCSGCPLWRANGQYCMAESEEECVQVNNLVLDSDE